MHLREVAILLLAVALIMALSEVYYCKERVEDLENLLEREGVNMTEPIIWIPEQPTNWSNSTYTFHNTTYGDVNAVVVSNWNIPIKDLEP